VADTEVAGWEMVNMVVVVQPFVSVIVAVIGLTEAQSEVKDAVPAAPIATDEPVLQLTVYPGVPPVGETCAAPVHWPKHEILVVIALEEICKGAGMVMASE
jgi:hypothetical protein